MQEQQSPLNGIDFDLSEPRLEVMPESGHVVEKVDVFVRDIDNDTWVKVRTITRPTRVTPEAYKAQQIAIKAQAEEASVEAQTKFNSLIAAADSLAKKK